MVFIESKAFTRRLTSLAGDSADQVLRQIQNDLIQDPERGQMVKGLGGIRKARVANPRRGKGTRGGYRYMHLYLAHRSHIHLLVLFDKDEQEDLDNKERIALRQMVAELKRLQEDTMAKKIKVKAYDDLRHSLRDALEYERGRPVDLRVTECPAPPKEMKPEEIRRVRASLNASQPLFASFLCVSTKAVQAWEQGVRRPQKTALRLLDIAKRNPAVLLKS